MITKTQYRLLVEDYMNRYDISEDEARHLINKHKNEAYIKALQVEIIENYNISSL